MEEPDKAAWILGHSASIARPGDRQVVVPVDDLLLSGVAGTILKQLD
jgi:hypothetical protein